ncbi:hypothetical protein FGG69_gp63 [Salinibacter phage SRUTV-1]|uniref:Primase n=1 Tax=Salinibacter phage SRUTV-1 TaxID=2684227 RepID=A0A2D3FAG5_9CAUD|nr:hypothetical protein FGG69_gp63 [Salinibacter phage SRUTV-1]ATU47004.1 hypothetical protein [Salinibacter phage SRUTV-1]
MSQQVDKSMFRNAEILDGPKEDRATRSYGHAMRWMNSVASEGRDSGPAFTSVGWWKPGNGGSREAQVMTPWLWFDIDAKDDIPGAYRAARGLISDLYEAGFHLDWMWASFSGSKGFHVRISTAQMNLPVFANANEAHSAWKTYFRPLVKKYPIDTNPMSPLLPIRLTGSCHADTGNRKWTMRARRFAKDWNKVEAIIDEFAYSKQTIPIESMGLSDALVSEFPYPHDAPVVEELTEPLRKIVRDHRREAERTVENTERNDGRFSLMPDSVWQAFQGVAESERFATGHAGRDEAAFMLACHWLSRGKGEQRTLELLRMWDAQRNDPPIQDDPTEQDLVEKVRKAGRKLYFDGDLQTKPTL